MSAIFDFSSLITVFVLSICTTTYLRELRPAIFDHTITLPSSSGTDPTTTTTNGGQQQQIQRQLPHHHRDGMMGFLWKCSRIGERMSPYISIACIFQSINILFFQ